jgi:hypothetical protein
MKTLEDICGLDLWKKIGKGILGREGDEMKLRK